MVWKFLSLCKNCGSVPYGGVSIYLKGNPKVHIHYTFLFRIRARVYIIKARFFTNLLSHIASFDTVKSVKRA